MTTASMADAAAADPSGRSWGLWRRQVGGIVRLELGKVLLLAARTAIIMLFGQEANATAVNEQLFAAVFQTLILRLCVFFGCLAIFINLFRGEMHQRTLHYYLLAPVRREVLAGGKFLGGWLGAAALFGGSVLVTRLLLLAQGDMVRVASDGNWPWLTLAYLGVTLLACLCYGAVFTVIGILPINPIGPALFLFAWEWVNLFMPAVLKPLSVIYWLAALFPVPLDLGPVAILSTPPPAALALAALLGASALLLGLAMRRARGLEISYGDD